jgi:hypothetical protein
VTPAAAPASRNRKPGRPASAVPWRQLAQVTMRQHRTVLLWAGIAVAVTAVALAATGIPIHQLAARDGLAWQDARASVDSGLLQAFALLLQLFPLLAGMFIGAPLLPREIERGTARLAWTQAASRPRWLLAQVLPVAALAALAAAGLGAEFSWWQAPFPGSTNSDSVSSGAWSPQLFNLSPLLLAGWAVLAFTLGVFLGAAARRTLPAMAATLLCYGAVLHEVAYSWRLQTLAPLHRAFTVTFHSDRSYSWGGYWGQQQPVDISDSLGYRDGRLLSGREFSHPAAWLRLHHIVMWETYEPASRYHTFQLIELGWLIAASALLIAAAVYLIRRRPA